MFSKKGNQAHELVTKILQPKTASADTYSRFERVFIYAITEGISINWPLAILQRLLRISKQMVYGYLVMDICRAYELYLKGYKIQYNIEYKVIESRILNNAHFHNLRCEDRS